MIKNTQAARLVRITPNPSLGGITSDEKENVDGFTAILLGITTTSREIGGGVNDVYVVHCAAAVVAHSTSGEVFVVPLDGDQDGHYMALVDGQPIICGEGDDV